MVAYSQMISKICAPTASTYAEFLACAEHLTKLLGGM